MSDLVPASSFPWQPSFPLIHEDPYVFNKFSFFIYARHQWDHSVPKCFFQPSMVLNKPGSIILIFPDSSKCQIFSDSKRNSPTFPWPSRIFSFTFPDLTCGDRDKQQAMVLRMLAHFLPTIKWFTAAGLFHNENYMSNQKLSWIKLSPVRVLRDYPVNSFLEYTLRSRNNSNTTHFSISWPTVRVKW